MADLLGLINDKYTPDEFMESEVKILNIVGCDFSIPLVSQYFGLYLAHESEAMRKKVSLPHNHLVYRFLCNICSFKTSWK